MIKDKKKLNFEKDSKLMKDIVGRFLEVDIMEDSRKRGIVDARTIYTKVLHDKGYSYPMIAGSLNKDHSTLVHHIQVFNDIVNIMDDLRLKYTMCRDEFFQLSKVRFSDDDSRFEQYKDEILHLKKRLEYIEFKERELSILEFKYKRLHNIINFIDEQTKDGEEDKIKCKIFAALK